MLEGVGRKPMCFLPCLFGSLLTAGYDTNNETGLFSVTAKGYILKERLYHNLSKPISKELILLKTGRERLPKGVTQTTEKNYMG